MSIISIFINHNKRITLQQQHLKQCFKKSMQTMAHSSAVDTKDIPITRVRSWSHLLDDIYAPVLQHSAMIAYRTESPHSH